MLVEAIAKGPGQTFSEEIPSITSSILEMFADLDFTDKKIKEVLDRLNVSADAKSALYAVSKATLRIGQTVVKIGRKIIDCIVKLIEEFPTAGLGLIIGGILGFLVGAIPVLGFLLGPIVTPIFMAIGIVGGVAMDIHDKLLAKRIAEINRKFAPLAGE